MIGFLLYLTNSILIPILNTKRPYINHVDEGDIENLVSTEKYVCLYVPLENNYDNIVNQTSFSSLSTIYKNKVSFVMAKSIPKDLIPGNHSNSELFLFYNHSLFLAAPYPNDENTLLHVIDLLITQKHLKVTKLIELQKNLGSYLYTLITPPEMMKSAIELRSQLTNQHGFIDIIECKHTLLSHYNMTNNKILLFNKRDKSIEQIRPTISDFNNISEPLYKIFTKENLYDPNLIYVGLVDEQLSEAQADYLFDVAQMMTNLTVGYIPPNLFHLIDKVTLRERKVPNQYGFNMYWRYYFPHDAYNGYALDFPFSKKDYFEKFERYMKELANGSLLCTWHVENVSYVENNAPLQKHNAVTYKNLFRDDRDCIVLYIDEKRGYYRELDEMKKAAEIFEEANPFGIKFCYINITRNSGKFRYPSLYPSRIRFYVGGKNESSVPFLQKMTSEDITRFALHLATNRTGLNTIKVQPKDPLELKDEVRYFRHISPKLSEPDRNVTEKYFSEVLKELEIPNDFDNKTEHEGIEESPYKDL